MLALDSQCEVNLYRKQVPAAHGSFLSHVASERAVAAPLTLVCAACWVWLRSTAT